ncbi:MAG: FlgD immunoglobulin-like domain containing protein [bacterium]
MKSKQLARIFLLGCFCCFWTTCIYGQGFEWAKQTEGLAPAEGLAIATGPEGNVFVTGYYIGSTTFESTTISDGPIFVAKYRPDGTLVWVSSADGTSNDKGYAIAVDVLGNAYITGTFSAFGNSTTFGDTTLTGTDGENIFVAKINSAGTWQWAVQAGSPTGGLQNNNFGTGTSVDAAGNAYVCGSFKSTVDFGDTSLVSAGVSDMFVAKYDSAGAFQWARRGGGLSGDQADAITVDASGNSYVTGGFQGTVDFADTTFHSAGDDDLFIAKYTTAGELEWLHSVGGTTTDHGHGIGLGASGDIYISGALNSAFATFGDTTLNAAFKGSNIFLAKCNSAGDFLWARLAGDNFHGNVKSLSADPSDNFFITGYYQGTAVFAGDTLSTSTFADRNIFVVNYNSAGEVQLAQNVVGIERTESHGVAVDLSGHAYLTGVFHDTVTFSNTTLATDIVPALFVTKLSHITVGVQQGSIEMPKEFRLAQNYPNPFNPTTTIQIELPKQSEITLNIYNIKGQLVRTLIDGKFNAGSHSVVWDGRDYLAKQVPSGLYISRMQMAEFVDQKKMLLVK